MQTLAVSPCRINDNEAGYAYPARARFELAEKDIDAYHRAADFLNINSVDVVSPQFEYGIELKITHEELSTMVGTTRHRISLFMQRFHNLGLIETNKDRFFIIKEKKLTDYLAQIA